MCGRQWDRIKLKWYLCWGRACSVLSRHPSYCYKAYIVPIHISYGYHFLFHRRSSSCWTAIEIGLVDMLSSKFRSCSRMSSYLQLTLTIKIKIKMEKHRCCQPSKSTHTALATLYPRHLCLIPVAVCILFNEISIQFNHFSHGNGRTHVQQITRKSLIRQQLVKDSTHTTLVNYSYSQTSVKRVAH